DSSRSRIRKYTCCHFDWRTGSADVVALPRPRSLMVSAAGASWSIDRLACATSAPPRPPLAGIFPRPFPAIAQHRLAHHANRELMRCIDDSQQLNGGTALRRVELPLRTRTHPCLSQDLLSA